jgi:hypothetical protein
MDTTLLAILTAGVTDEFADVKDPVPSVKPV